MKEAGTTDTLTVVNGPEDGTEFPLSRAPFMIGRGAACAVNLRLDGSVEQVHARATSASDGYRVRGTTSAPVFVDGKRAGIVRSRILREGGYLKVGHTELVLECSGDGLASRSGGLVSESDVAWALRKGIGGLARLLAKVSVRVPILVFRRWKLILLAALILLYLFVPSFRGLSLAFASNILALGRRVLAQVLG